MIAKSHRSECAIVQLVTVRDNGGVLDNLQAPIWFLSSYQHAFGLSNSGYELCAKNENGGEMYNDSHNDSNVIDKRGLGNDIYQRKRYFVQRDHSPS